MTKLADAIEALRAAVSDPESDDREAVLAAADSSVFEDIEIGAIPGGRTLAFVSVRPVDPVRVEELEEVLGPGRRLPRNPSGGDRTVMFTDTLPGDGESGATVLAEADDDGRVSRLIVRADMF